ncbi:hypothetical protein PSA7680_01679 [Pseudoruegeria aquimaris]|uniref:Uncharacterized protein n=1 Tax=Pseudoruegeria aquimaris TaxID=393663 RepID=A0A1Y5S9N6_9RHOB|nr:hypothetical protein [Pseudoruegeria aquimaris]SLN35679.1 hypothetical protein PSA7680_01679 [Pseudoruegeria aquimaris]
MAALAAGALMMLAGAPTEAPAAPSRNSPENTRPAALRVRVSEPAVVIAGPAGYCVDLAASRQRDGEAFVLLGSCAAITQDARHREPAVRAVITASVSGLEAGYTIAQTLPSLERYFRSEEGRRILSRDGRAESIDVLETRTEGRVFYVRTRDLAQGAAAGGSAEYWRAFFDVDGHIVSASVLGTEAAPLSAQQGLSVLKSFVRKISRENRS